MLERDEQGVVLLTAGEVAEILKLKGPRSVYKLSKRLRWGFQRTISGRCVRYERRGLLRWIRRRPPGRSDLTPQVRKYILTAKEVPNGKEEEPGPRPKDSDARSDTFGGSGPDSEG